MPLPGSKGPRRPPPVVASGLTPLPAAGGPTAASPNGSTSSTSPSPNHPRVNTSELTDDSVEKKSQPPESSPLGATSGSASSSSHKFTVTIVCPIEAGACGEVSVIKYEDPSKKKVELRVMKEMENRNKQKCDREKAQFNRQSCHPNMIKYFYYGPSCTSNKNSHTQVQMELMDLGSLKRVMDNTKLSPEDRRMFCETVGYQIFMGLDYFHHFHGGMHRDVKPANILLNTQGRAKLCDFDASVADSMIHDTAIGTVSYAAPEVIAFQPHDFKCDVWSAGTVLFEMAAGRHPYMQPGAGGMIGGMISSNGCLSEGIDWKLVEHMPPSFTDLLKNCLTENQSARFSSSEAITHKFFDDINKGRRRDQRAETQLRKLGIDVDPDASQKMHISWRNFVAHADGSSFASSSSGGGTPVQNQRTASSLGDECDDLNASNFGSPSTSALLNVSTTSESVVPGVAAPPAVGTPADTPVVCGGPAPGSPEAKEKAMKVSNVMKSILYNWEHASVNILAKWLKGRSSELQPIVTPEQMKGI